MKQTAKHPNRFLLIFKPWCIDKGGQKGNISMSTLSLGPKSFTIFPLRVCCDTDYTFIHYKILSLIFFWTKRIKEIERPERRLIERPL